MTSDKIKAGFRWYCQTSMLIGMPIVLLLILVGAQKLFFTGTCHVAGMGCEYSLGATDAMAAYMGDLLDANPGMDIVAEPRRKSK